MTQFIMQLASLQMTSAITKIRFNVLIWSLNFLMIVSVSVRRIRSVSLVIYIRLSVILCHFMHLVSSYIEWWTLKSLTSRCSSDLLSSCYKLYMRNSLLMFYKDFESNKYMLWMCSIMSFSLRVSDERSDLECFTVQDKIRIFLFIKKHAWLQCCCE